MTLPHQIVFLVDVDNTLYAHDTKVVGALPPEDVTIEQIGDLLDHDLSRLVSQPRPVASSLKVR